MYETTQMSKNIRSNA